MKTPQQIKNEVEKEINRLVLDKDFIDKESDDDFQRVLELRAQLSILTEYDKSIKEMIEEIIEKKKESLMNDNLIIGDWWSSEIFTGLEIDELLSKIGDNSEVEK